MSIFELPGRRWCISIIIYLAVHSQRSIFCIFCVLICLLWYWKVSCSHLVTQRVARNYPFQYRYAPRKPYQYHAQQWFSVRSFDKMVISPPGDPDNNRAILRIDRIYSISSSPPTKTSNWSHYLLVHKCRDHDSFKGSSGKSLGSCHTIESISNAIHVSESKQYIRPFPNAETPARAMQTSLAGWRHPVQLININVDATKPADRRRAALCSLHGSRLESMAVVSINVITT